MAITKRVGGAVVVGLAPMHQDSPRQLVVTAAEVVEYADTIGISARLVLDGPSDLPQPPESLVVRVHDLSGLGSGADDVVAGVVAGGLTPLVPALATAAAAYDADLVIDGPVCATAVAGACEATEVAARWFGSPRVAIHAATGVDAALTAAGRGLLFSRGLDSMATLRVMRQNGIGPTHLVGMDWVDDPYAGPPQAGIWQATSRAADELGLPLVRVSTDARTLLDPLVSWSRAHVAVLAGGGLALGGILSTVGVSSTYSADSVWAYPSHRQLDHLWSSAAVAIEHRCDVEGTRIDKAAVVAGDPWASQWLKVCWERPGDGNCGRCRKCLMTMSALWLVGASQVIDSAFDGELEPDSITACAGSHAMVAPGNFIDVSTHLHAVADGQTPSPPVVVGATEHDRRFARALVEAWDIVITSGQAS